MPFERSKEEGKYTNKRKNISGKECPLREIRKKERKKENERIIQEGEAISEKEGRRKINE